MVCLWTQCKRFAKTLVQPPAHTLGCLPCGQSCFECPQEEIAEPLGAACSELAHPHGNFFSFYYLGISCIPACVFSATSFCSALWGSLTLSSPKVVPAALRSFLEAGVMSLLTSVSQNSVSALSVWVSACHWSVAFSFGSECGEVTCPGVHLCMVLICEEYEII